MTFRINQDHEPIHQAECRVVKGDGGEVFEIQTLFGGVYAQVLIYDDPPEDPPRGGWLPLDKLEFSGVDVHQTWTFVDEANAIEDLPRWMKLPQSAADLYRMGPV